MVSPGLSSRAISSQASLCGGQEGGCLENVDPAEPDDPNSFSPNPSEHKKLGVDGSVFEVDEAVDFFIYYFNLHFPEF